ncbi:class I SAM-dependent methyltransferase [Dokdonella sp. MW10]|uniref:class I SAM-dependent methyltransferase n=1 Tax=Dokdonella sp. MW10 TaxID=2992926 RepID=UPI003F7D2A6B
MTDITDAEARILASWQRNGAPWTRAVRDGAIASRVLATNAAVVAAVLALAPRRVLDVGCGEGWLARELASHGLDVTGVDAVPALVDDARAGGGGRFEVMDYEALAAGALGARFDLAVCNFSLIGGASVDALVAAMPRLLEPGGMFIVQTLHPLEACGAQPYRDGWREGSWAGFDDTFRDPAPWFFRTLESWIALLRSSCLVVEAVREPLHPRTGRPASLILVARNPAS